MLDEALPLIDAFLRGEAVDHDGEHYRVQATLTPAGVQKPRPPIWVAATLPNRGPIARARRWDGIFPLSSTVDSLRPEELSGLVESLDAPAGFEVISALGEGKTANDLAAAGATWAIDGPRSPNEPRSQLRRRVDAGPPR
jgi:hypothetical protein